MTHKTQGAEEIKLLGAQRWYQACPGLYCERSHNIASWPALHPSRIVRARKASRVAHLRSTRLGFLEARQSKAFNSFDWSRESESILMAPANKCHVFPNPLLPTSHIMLHRPTPTEIGAAND